MDNKRKNSDLRIPVAFGVIGFFFTGALSLSVGNTMVTSIVRGAVGLFGCFILGYIIRFAIRTFVGAAPEQKEEVRGKHLDLLLPEERVVKQRGDSSRTQSPDEAEFVPWNPDGKSTSEKIGEIDPEKLAQALRHLDD